MRTTEELLKDAEVLISGSKLDGKGFVRDVLMDSMASLIAELSAKLREREEEEAVYTLKQSSMTQLAIESFYDFLQLTKHGAKSIDIYVRRDAKEYTFQADFLKYITPPKKET